MNVKEIIIMIEWKPEAKVFLPSSYEDWKENFQRLIENKQKGNR